MAIINAKIRGTIILWAKYRIVNKLSKPTKIVLAFSVILFFNLNIEFKINLVAGINQFFNLYHVVFFFVGLSRIGLIFIIEGIVSPSKKPHGSMGVI